MDRSRGELVMGQREMEIGKGVDRCPQDGKTRTGSVYSQDFVQQ